MKYFRDNNFFIGCNYWASHCGINMWQNWDRDIVERDLNCLAENNIKVIRVFPLWSYFQPIEIINEYGGKFAGYSIDGGKTLLYDNSENAGINEEAFQKFSEFLKIAEDKGISVIPAIITGWMSGRLFVPPALVGKNLISDPIALKWEVRFCRYFVKRFKEQRNIIGWCLGNECNCMANVQDEAQAWLWTSLLSDAIRSCDTSRPVISGMHSLKPHREGYWTITNQGENCDVITTHPYACEEYKTDVLPADNFRVVMHPACQTVYYRDISNKPCYIEEIGTYGEMYANKDITAAYAKNTLFNAWAHNCSGYLWWIAFDQGHLKYHPFGYNNRASNYGLFEVDYTSKNVYSAINDFNEFISGFEYKSLPNPITDGICLVTPNCVSWPLVSSAYNLAKLAGMNLGFAYIEDQIPDSQLYFLPSLNSNSISTNALESLMKKVESGSVLYLSLGGGLLRNLSTDFGFKIRKRYNISGFERVDFCSDNHNFSLNLDPTIRFDIELDNAKCLAKASDGTPIMTVCNYGKGKLIFFAHPLEKRLYEQIEGYEGEHYKIYEIVRDEANINRKLSTTNPYVTLTEHITEKGTRIVVAINNTNINEDVVLVNPKKEELIKCYRGNISVIDNQSFSINISANDAVVFEISNK